MRTLDHFASRSLCRTLWGAWYALLSRRMEDGRYLLLSGGYEEAVPMGLPLSPEDEPERWGIQLYHHVGSQASLEGKAVLDVSCGHGGGVAYLKRYLNAAKATGMDLNRSGIAFCLKHHRMPGLDFTPGDAARMPFPDASFDVVVNVEASHGYPDFRRFLAEVRRVLKPGGTFHYADFRFTAQVPSWERELKGSRLERVAQRDITAEVLRGLKLYLPRKLEVIRKRLPAWAQAFGHAFSGVEGSAFHRGLQCRTLSYRSFLLRKA